MRLLSLSAAILLLSPPFAAAEIDAIWLTCNGDQPDRIVVNWWTDRPGDSVVRFGPAADSLRKMRRQSEPTQLHQVEIPLASRDSVVHYRVQTGAETSAIAAFKTFPTASLRIAVAADWQSQPDLTAIGRDDVHLLLTAGDMINNLWQACGPGEPACVAPYLQLIRQYPELFRSTPFMPVLGNHDREVHPRGTKPPAHAVYDVEATAFRRFFALPDDEWKWSFDIPAFKLRLIALDFNHTSDFGSTWQTCHPFDPNSTQFRWYDRLTATNPAFTVTLYNERNATMRTVHEGAWQHLFRRGTICVTGFGYFAERAEVDGLTCYNTALTVRGKSHPWPFSTWATPENAEGFRGCRSPHPAAADYFHSLLNGTGTLYPDPHSAFLAREDSYLLLTCEQERQTLTAELKTLAGRVLDRQLFSAKRPNR